MAVTNKLGPFNFIRMSPAPLLVGEGIARTAQPGKDGTSYWKTGKRGQPFQVVTLVEAPNLAAGYELYRLYYELLGEGPQPMMWAGRVLPDQMFKVLDVQPAGQGSIKTIGVGYGGVGGGTSFAVVEVVWTLEAVANPPSEEE